MRRRRHEATTGHAADWLAAWNAHDVEAIMSCCAADAIVVANTVVTRWGRRQSSIHGKAAVREHFTRELMRARDLAMTRETLLVTPGAYALLYRRENGDRELQTIELDADVRAARVTIFDESAIRD